MSGAAWPSRVCSQPALQPTACAELPLALCTPSLRAARCRRESSVRLWTRVPRCCARAQPTQRSGPARQTPATCSAAADRLREAGPAAALAAPLVLAGAARADEAAPASPDVFISIAFVLAIGALALVTLGVLYLTLTSWLDKRTENADRERLAQAEKDRKLSALGVTPKRKRVPEGATRGGGKGFGG